MVTIQVQNLINFNFVAEVFAHSESRADRTKHGVPLPDDTWAAIVSTARVVGVSEVSI
jgi:hypothetical protein